MSISILIDTAKMKVLKKVVDKNSIAICEAWATLLIPHHDFLVVGEERRFLSVFTLEELYALGENSGGFIPEAASYPTVLLGVTELYADLEADLSSLDTIQAQIRVQQKNNPAMIPVEFVASPTMERKTKREDKPNFYMKGAQTARIKSSGTPNKSNKPKSGSTTGRVWDIADSLYIAGSEITKALRTAIIEECENQGINASTAATQYSKWKKSASPT